MHFKTCKRCNNNYRTNSKHSKICDDCNISRRSMYIRKLQKKRYLEKEQT